MKIRLLLPKIDFLKRQIHKPQLITFLEGVKKALLAQKDQLQTNWDAFIAAWIAYGLSQEGFQHNQPLNELASALKQWASENEVWEYERNLGPLAFLCWLEKGKICDSTLITKLSNKIKDLRSDYKLSLLRDPEQVFLIALGLSALDDKPQLKEAKDRLVEKAKKEVQSGPLRRKILFSAALRQLNENNTIQKQESQEIGDTIALLWWNERYGENLKNEYWQHFSNVNAMVALDVNAATENQRILSPPELAMLYETLFRIVSQRNYLKNLKRIIPTLKD